MANLTDILKGSDYALTIFTEQEVKAIKLFDKGGWEPLAVSRRKYRSGRGSVGSQRAYTVNRRKAKKLIPAYARRGGA